MLLSRLRHLTWLSLKAEARNAGLRLVAAIGAIGSLLVALFWEGHPAILGLVLYGGWGRLCSAAACVWFAYSAVRDFTEHLGPAIRPKPAGGAVWVTAHWLAGLGVWFGVALVGFLAGALGGLKSGPGVLLPCLLAYLRTVPVLFAMGTLAFSASRLTRSPIGGILVTFAWFCAAAGVQYIPEFLRPEYFQNLALFAGAACALLPFLLWVENVRRRDRLSTAPLLACAAAAVLFAIAGGSRVLANSPSRLMNDAPGWMEMSGQDIQVGDRLPGFQLPRLGGAGEVKTSDFPGKILVLYIFTSADRESLRMLPALEALQAEYADQGVQPVGICLTPDAGEAWQVALSGRFRFPILRDPTSATVAPQPDGAVAMAYRAEILPKLLITDRHRRLRVDSVDAEMDLQGIKLLIAERLRLEPR